MILFSLVQLAVTAACVVPGVSTAKDVLLYLGSTLCAVDQASPTSGPHLSFGLFGGSCILCVLRIVGCVRFSVGCCVCVRLGARYCRSAVCRIAVLDCCG